YRWSRKCDIDWQRRRSGERQAAAGHRQNRGGQTGEVLPDLLFARPRVREEELRNVGQGTHCWFGQPTRRRDQHSPVRPVPGGRGLELVTKTNQLRNVLSRV